MGAALAWWRPGLSPALNDPAVRSSDSPQCTSAREQYLAALSSADVPGEYYYIFIIASHYCGDTHWEADLDWLIDPDDSNSMSVFGRVLPKLTQLEPYSQDVANELSFAGNNILQARFELSLYYLIKHGDIKLCDRFYSSRSWYREGVFTTLERDNAIYLMRRSCDQ